MIAAPKHEAGRRHLIGQMVGHARRALACYRAGNHTGFKHHAAQAREIADVVAPRGSPDWTLQTR